MATEDAVAIAVIAKYVFCFDWELFLSVKMTCSRHRKRSKLGEGEDNQVSGSHSIVPMQRGTEALHFPLMHTAVECPISINPGRHEKFIRLL